MLNLWGFINFMVLIFAGCCALTGSACRTGECCIILAAMVAFLTGLSYLGQFFTMIVMRSRHAGRVCSGDFNTEFQFWKLNQVEEPYLHMTSTWLFYSIVTQLYFAMMVVSGMSFFAGLDSY